MKSALSFVSRVRAHMPGRPDSKETRQGGSQPGPSSAASGEIEPRRSSRSTRSNDAGETPARRSAPPSRTSGTSIHSTPAASFRSGDVPSQSGQISGLDLDGLIKELDAQVHEVEGGGHSRQPVLQTTSPQAPTSEFAEMRTLVDALMHKSHRTKTQLQADYFRSMGDLISELALAGRIQWGARDQDQLELLRRFSGELAHRSEDTPAAGENIRTHLDKHKSDTANLDKKAQNALQQLLHAHLPQLLAHIQDPDTLKHLANDLVTEIDGHEGLRAQLKEQGAPPTLLQAVDDVVASIRKDITLAGSEFKLQRELLAKVGGALLAIGEGKIDGLAGGLNDLLRKAVPKQVLKWLGVNTRSRAQQVRDELAEHSGPYYRVDVSKEDRRKLDMSLKPASIGQFTTGQIEEHLSNLAHRKKGKPKFLHWAADAVAAKHPKLTTLADRNGQTQVRLAEQTQQHLDELRQGSHQGEAPATHHTLHHLTAAFAREVQDLGERHAQHGSERHQEALTQANDALRALTRLNDMPPRDRMGQAASRAMEAAQFGVLKLSLLQSFSGRVAEKALEGENRWQINQPLTQAKASLLAETMEEVLGSPTKEKMLDLLAHAERKHEEILREKNFSGGGQTAELLKDLRSAIERF